MDTQSIATVKAILSEGSFQNAAQRLNCSQSTVTFQVRQLENELSIRLFEKIGRKMVFTQAGKDILPHIDAILSSMQKIKTYSNGCGELSGTLHIAVAESLLSYKVHSVLGKFVKSAPAVRIELHSMNCHDIKNGILAGEYDMGVYYDVGGHPHTLEMTRLGDVDGVIVASPNLPPELRDFDAPNQKKDICFIINEPRSIYRERMEAHLYAKNILLRNTIELWSIETIKKSVINNLGISFLPRFAVERELADGTLVELAANMPQKMVTAICVRHCNREFNPAMQLFKNLLVNADIFSQQADLLQK